MEVPFGSVSWERKISSAGSFSGSVAADPNEDHFSLYESTMPGRTGLYVMRDGVCAWGGIIWSRDYSITDRVLSISALEFTSYLYHRIFWKTMTIAEGQTVTQLIEQIIQAAFNDQLNINERLGYSASDVYNVVSAYSQSTTTVTLVTTEPHGFVSGNSVLVGGFTGVTYGGFTYFNGTKPITKVNDYTFTFTVPAGNSATYSSVFTGAGFGTFCVLQASHDSIQASAAISMGYEIQAPRDAGEVGLDDYIIHGSGDNNPFTFRGSEMRYIGEILENFSKNGVPSYLSTDPNQLVVSTRFDYFVDCQFDPNTFKFVNTFKAWYIRKDVNTQALISTSTPELSALYGPSQLNASALIFEHPGNIIAMSIGENADASSSRTWVVDNANDNGTEAAKYYASYTNLPYLNNNWPILETAITDRNFDVYNDQEVAPYAKAIGYRLAPPIGQYQVTVNGSISPTVNTYKPGDWCVVIPGDVYVNNRLKPPYENRTGLLVRKIASMKVTVPDNPTFPESVELELVPEWEVNDV
jgi:hypothetical protein